VVVTGLAVVVVIRGAGVVPTGLVVVVVFGCAVVETPAVVEVTGALVVLVIGIVNPIVVGSAIEVGRPPPDPPGPPEPAD
jgi:hypothetical protein